MFEDNLDLNGFGERGAQPQIQKQLVNGKFTASAFTLIELLVVIAIIAILAAVLLPVLAAAKAKSLQAGCINNVKQLAVGWMLYATDNQDYMVPNSPYGYPANESWCPNKSSTGATMGWNATYVGNTNQAVYANTILAPYMGGQLGVYRCPADIWPSANGTRVRDYSMQGEVGNLYCKGSAATGGTLKMNPNQIAYVKVTELRSAPGPSDTIVFLEEHPNSLLGNQVFDGYLEVDATPGDNGAFPDVPGSMHRWSCGMSFADGHAEMHKWLQSGYLNYSSAGGITTLKIPVVPSPSWGTICASPAIVQLGATSPDWVWFTTHCSGKNPTPGS